MRWARLFIAAAMLLALVVTAAGGTPAGAADDTTAPVLVSFDFSPRTVDASISAQTIVVTGRITDDLAGLSYGYVSITSPSGRQLQGTSFNSNNRTSGTAQDGTYRATVTLPRYSEQGTWKVTSFTAYDAVQNRRELDSIQLAEAGFPTTLEQTGIADTTAPQLVSFDLTPRSVDSSTGAQTIVATARITDDLAGATYASGYFRSPSGAQQVYASFGSNNRTSGNAQDGTYRTTLTLPRYSAQGTWTLGYFSIYDAVQNHRDFDELQFAGSGFPTTFEQTGIADTTAPQLVSFNFTPRSVDTSTAAQTIVITARVTDELAGMTSANGTFRSPSGQQQYFGFGSINRTSGNAQDGTYRVTVTLPRYSEQGVWKLGYFSMYDGVQNRRELDETQFVEAGFPTIFEIKPASPPDQPTDVTATPADGAASVSWSAPFENGRSPITSYTVTAYHEGTAAGSATTPNGSTTSTTVGGLTNGQAYTFTVKATNAIGTGAESIASTSVTPRTIPGKPTRISAIPGDGTATVSWTEGTDGGSPITGHTVTVYQEGTPVASQTQVGASPSMTVGGLANGLTYSFSVHATNVVGSSAESGPSAAITPRRPPGAPSITSATAGNGSATISWVAPSDDGGSPITEYTVTAYQAGAPVKSLVVHHSARSATVSGLTNGSDYVFTVTATNDAGPGPSSNPSATVRPSRLADLPTPVPVPIPVPV